jgi:hypothetical protein
VKNGWTEFLKEVAPPTIFNNKGRPEDEAQQEHRSTLLAEIYDICKQEEFKNGDVGLLIKHCTMLLPLTNQLTGPNNQYRSSAPVDNDPCLEQPLPQTIEWIEGSWDKDSAPPRKKLKASSSPRAHSPSSSESSIKPYAFPWVSASSSADMTPPTLPGSIFHPLHQDYELYQHYMNAPITQSEMRDAYDNQNSTSEPATQIISGSGPPI